MASVDKVGVEDLMRHHFIQAQLPIITPVIATAKILAITHLGNLADELMLLMKNNVVQIDVTKVSLRKIRAVFISRHTNGISTIL